MKHGPTNTKFINGIIYLQKGSTDHHSTTTFISVCCLQYVSKALNQPIKKNTHTRRKYFFLTLKWKAVSLFYGGLTEILDYHTNTRVYTVCHFYLKSTNRLDEKRRKNYGENSIVCRTSQVIIKIKKQINAKL